MPKCAAITQAGGACKGIPKAGSQYCYVHDPEHAQERKRHGSKGGKRGGRGRPLAEVNETKSHLRGLVAGVLNGSVDRKNAAVAAQILNIYLRAVDVGLRAKEQEELVARLEELEANIEAANETRGVSGGF